MKSSKHNCKEELQNVDLKATPARLAVLDVLETTEMPLDVNMISAKLQKRHQYADPATVFRIINIFTQRGITKQLQLNEGKFRYELSSKIDHHHFVCQKCGRIEDISDCGVSAFEKQIEKKKGLLIKSHTLEFFGICQNCQE